MSDPVSYGEYLELFAPICVKTERDGENGLIIENGLALPPYPHTLIHQLRHQVQDAPDVTFLCERVDGEWQSISYAEFLQGAELRATKLLAAGCGPKRPLMILAPNSIEHAVSSFAAMMVGTPASSISPAYALMPGSFERLGQIAQTLSPGAVLFGEPSASGQAAEFLHEIIEAPLFSHHAGDDGLIRCIDDIEGVCNDTLTVAENSIGPDDTAKVLFTSGSTGQPKGVITTHRMLCSNQAALVTIWPFLQRKPPILVDWLPWSHTFGGNVCLNAVLFNGGTMYIDEGKPSPQLIGHTVTNLRSVSPTLHFNVPAGLEALLPHLERDIGFAHHFFQGLDILFVAGAALPAVMRQRLQAAGQNATGTTPVLIAGWGATETAPFATSVYFPTDRADNIGLPIPGTTVRLRAEEDKLTLAVKGPNVSPGYWRDHSATAAAFDNNGFYKMGDAGKLIDPDNPAAGIAFDGRVSENFKLSSGTWVNVGMLRLDIIDCLRPLCTDLVITGHNQSDIGVLLVPNERAIRRAYGKKALALDFKDLLCFETLTVELCRRLVDHNFVHSNGSTRVARFCLLPRLPEPSKNEITDKGYLNQRAMLANWAGLVESLHDDHAVSSCPGGLRVLIAATD